MTGKHVKYRQVNHLSITQGKDKVWRVRTTWWPHNVLFSDADHDIAYQWANRHRKLAKKEPAWSPQDLEYLSETYGTIPAAVIGQRLGRSVNALKIITYRKLGVNQRSNFYTATATAGEMGIP
ncbi:MAG: hypothetical protein Q8O55_07345 [Dehalococcoidales bacterium]|nr:hypothetical protein [Dehalococcoidales bacterium]